MHYVIQVLAAILVGTAFGALLGPRNNFLFITSLISIALGVVAIVTASWVPLAIGTAVLLITYAVPQKTASSGA